MDNMVKNIIIWIFPSNMPAFNRIAGIYFNALLKCLIIQRNAFSFALQFFLFTSIPFHDAAYLNKQIEYYLCTHRIKWTVSTDIKGYLYKSEWMDTCPLYDSRSKSTTATTTTIILISESNGLKNIIVTFTLNFWFKCILIT